LKRVMLIGPTGSGKTTLLQKIKGEDLNYSKTQTIQFESEMIDTPGEFLQHRGYYNALKVTSVDADVIGFVSNVSEKEQIYAPSFHSYFTKPVIGILTKMDLADTDEEVKEAHERLQMAGARKIFEVSAYSGEGVKELVSYLHEEVDL